MLPELFARCSTMLSHLREEIAVVFDRDPAARNTWEVITCYPGFHALLVHRLAHALWRSGLRGRRVSCRIWAVADWY